MKLSDYFSFGSENKRFFKTIFFKYRNRGMFTIFDIEWPLPNNVLLHKFTGLDYKDDMSTRPSGCAVACGGVRTKINSLLL